MSHSMGGRTAIQASEPSGGGFGGSEWATILSSAISGISDNLPRESSGVDSKQIKKRMFADLLAKALGVGNKIRNTELNSNQYLTNERASNFRNQADSVIQGFRRGR